MNALRLLATGALVSAMLACRATVPAGFGGERTEAGAPIEVIVTNLNWSTISVYVVFNSGSRQLLGMVETGRTEALTIPASVATALDLRLAVHPVGSREAFVTERLPMTDGMSIELTVENNLDLSHWEVRQ